MKQIILGLLSYVFCLTSYVSQGQSNVNASSITLGGTGAIPNIKDTATFLCSGHPCPLGTLILSKNASDTTVFIKQLSGWKVLSSGGTIIGVTATTPLSATGMTTRNLSIQQANTTNNGYLSNTDWNTFNNKQHSFSLTTTGTSGAATFSSNILNIPNYAATPAGSNTQIQFNSSGIFGASSSLVWNGSQIGIGGTLYGANNIVSISDYSIIPANTTGSNGHLVDIAGGDVSSGVGNGGDVILDTGTGSGGGTNGRIRLNIVNDYIDISQTSGLMTFTGTNTSTTVGENISLIGGHPTAGTNNGGNITLRGGVGNGGGITGNVNLNSTGLGAVNIGNATGQIVLGTAGIFNGLNYTDNTGAASVWSLDDGATSSSKLTFGVFGGMGFDFQTWDNTGFTGNNSVLNMTSGIVTITTPSDIVYTVNSVAGSIPLFFSNTATLDFGSTAAGASTDLTVALTNCVIGDIINLGVPNASTLSNGVFTAWVSVNGTVKVRFTNTNLVSALDPASGAFKVGVIR